MAITHFWVEDGCIGFGMSKTNCPEVFKLDEELNLATVKKDINYAAFESKIKQATMGCLVEFIKYEDS